MKQIIVYVIEKYGDIVNITPAPENGQQFVDRGEYDKLVCKYKELEEKYWKQEVAYATLKEKKTFWGWLLKKDRS